MNRPLPPGGRGFSSKTYIFFLILIISFLFVLQSFLLQKRQANAPVSSSSSLVSEVDKQLVEEKKQIQESLKRAMEKFEVRERALEAQVREWVSQHNDLKIRIRKLEEELHGKKWDGWTPKDKQLTREEKQNGIQMKWLLSPTGTGVLVSFHPAIDKKKTNKGVSFKELRVGFVISVPLKWAKKPAYCSYQLEDNTALHFPSSASANVTTTQVEAFVLDIDESHNMPNKAIIVICPVNAPFWSNDLNPDTMSNNGKESRIVKMSLWENQASGYKFEGVDATELNYFFTGIDVIPKLDIPEEPTIKISACISPIFGDRLTEMIPQWVEYMKMMGVEYFHAYVDTTDTRIHRIIQEYVDQGIMSKYDWSPNTKYPAHYVNQHAANNDCLWRNRQNSQYLTFWDIDEWIASDLYPDLVSILKAHEQNSSDWDKYAEISLPNHIYSHYCDPTIFHKSPLHIGSMTWREGRQAAHQFPKSLVKPRMTPGMQVHWAHKPWGERFLGVPAVIRFHHYKNLFREYKCGRDNNVAYKHVEDDWLGKWKRLSELETRVINFRSKLYASDPTQFKNWENPSSVDLFMPTDSPQNPKAITFKSISPLVRSSP